MIANFNFKASFKQTTFALAGVAILTLALTACGSKNCNNDNGGPPVATPYGAGGYPGGPDSSCLNVIPETSPTYTTSWQDYRQHNIQPYAWGRNAGHGGGRLGFYQPYAAQFPSEGLCGCQQQTFPACGQQGLTCVPGGGFGNNQIATWGYNNGGFGFNNYQSPNQFGGYSGYGAGGGGCSNNVAQMCQPGQVTGNAVCQAVSPGNPYGVWVQIR